MHSVTVRRSDNATLLSQDTPVSAMEEQRILSGIPAPERFGLSVMKKFQGYEMGEDAKRELFERREKGTIHIVTAEHSRSLRHLHWWSVFVGLMIGTITCSFLSVFEAWFVGYMGCDGLTQTELECRDGNFSVSCEPAGLTDQASHEEHSWEYPVGHQLEGLGVCNGLCQTYVSLYPSADETSKECTHFCMDGTAIDGMKERECETSDAAVFWTLLIIAIGIQATFEIGLLYYYAIKYAVSVSECLQMRLHPLNRDRAFVGTSLVKSALELPNPSTAILGVDPLKDQGAMGPCAQACFLLIYKAKIGMTSVILKLILRRFLTRGSKSCSLLPLKIHWVTDATICRQVPARFCRSWPFQPQQYGTHSLPIYLLVKPSYAVSDSQQQLKCSTKSQMRSLQKRRTRMTIRHRTISALISCALSAVSLTVISAPA